MRRRLLRYVAAAVVVPAAAWAAEALADRLEEQRGPSTATRVLRRGAGVARRERRRRPRF